MAAGDYPCWVYDPTGVNPPMFVTGDTQYVALLNAPLPATAGPNANVPQIAPPPPATVAQSAVPGTAVLGGTTPVPVSARFTKMPTVGAPSAPVVVNTRPNVRPK